MSKKLFIHIPKNGGMTIRRSPMFSSMIMTAQPSIHRDKKYTKELHETMVKHGDHHGNEHARWRDLNEHAHNHEAFAFVRNPWSRTVSRFLFAKKVIQVEGKVDPSYADVSSLEAFLEERNKWGGMKYFWHRAVRGWYNQREYVINEKNEIVVNVLRTEHLDEDVSKFFGMEFTDRRRNVTGLTDDWKSLYTPKTIQTVADWHFKDIEEFGFDFDTPATKGLWEGLSLND